MTEDRFGVDSDFFFISGTRGNLFAAFFTPSTQAERASEGILYVHPFAEELNKSRRMAALQARAMADRGFSVLMVDLFGCGDSDGEFGEAEWEIWINDLGLCWKWLELRTKAPISLWGLRLGALLAIDVASRLACVTRRIVFWQAITNGERALAEFLRLRVASEMGATSDSRITVQQLMDSLSRGKNVEVSGYDLNPSLAMAIGRMSLDAFLPKCTDLHWLEIVSDPCRPLRPSSQRVVDKWSEADVPVYVHKVRGEPFWRTVEITECPELVHSTCGIHKVTSVG